MPSTPSPRAILSQLSTNPRSHIPRTTVYTHLHILSVFHMYTSYGYTAIHYTCTDCDPTNCVRSNLFPVTNPEIHPITDPGTLNLTCHLEDPKMGPFWGCIFRYTSAHSPNVRKSSYSVYHHVYASIYRPQNGAPILGWYLDPSTPI